MRKFQHNTTRILAVMGMALAIGLPSAGAGTENIPSQFTPSRTKFVLPGGEVIIGQIVSYKGEMFLVRLPRGMMLLRKDFPVAMKSLGTKDHNAPRTKPIF